MMYEDPKAQNEARMMKVFEMMQRSLDFTVRAISLRARVNGRHLLTIIGGRSDYSGGGEPTIHPLRERSAREGVCD